MEMAYMHIYINIFIAHHNIYCKVESAKTMLIFDHLEDQA